MATAEHIMKKYVFRSYSKIFQSFRKEKERIASNVNLQLVIEHVGSTAVPGLGGKGIIDIAIAVDKQNIELVSKQIQAIGYEFRPTFSTPDRLYFITYLTDSEEENRRYHIHLTYPENREWKEFLGFRDYLRSHPKEAKEYAELKEQAALEANGEGKKYRKLKEPIFKKITSETNKIKSHPKALIRQAKIEDANAIVEAEREIAKEPGYFCSQPSELTLENVVNTISAFKDGSGVYLVAEFDGKLIGHAFLKSSHLQSLSHIGDLNIAVHLGWQKQGIGTKLIQHIIEWAKKSGVIVKIQLNVRALNSSAISLYKKMGFEEEGRLKNRVKIKDGYIDDIVMGLSLLDAQQIGDVTIHTLEEEDIKLLMSDFCFPWSSIQATTDKWNRYYDEHQIQIRTVYVLKKEKKIIGYASLLHVSEYPNFKNAGIPEVNDVWITKDFRNKGFGKLLIQHLEKSARIKGHQQIGIGVGLYADYGIAQKLYFQLGYAPDGYGVTYNYQPTVPGETYPLDDELILWMTKNL
jgi:GrpB-like predicted nucleotidyltransferase (UPF0157 family)/GNAT superfamily N-acetyltransferase